MVSWKSLVLAVAFLAIITVTSAQENDITAEYACLPATDPTVTEGSFYVKMTPTAATVDGTAIALSKIEFLTTALAACGTNQVVLETNAAGEYTVTVHVTVPLNLDTDTNVVQCGVSYTDAITGYRLNFATASLTQGYAATSDKRFQIDCPSFKDITGELTSTSSYQVSDALGAVDATNTFPDGLTMEIQRADAGAVVSTFTAVAAATAGVYQTVGITDQLRVVITLDTALSTPVELVRIVKLTFTQTGADTTGNIVTRSATLVDMTDGTNVCPTADGAVLGLVSGNEAFTYSTDRTTVTLTSSAFEVLTFFSIAAETAGASTRPAMQVTADIRYCGTGGTCVLDSVATDAGEACTARRKRRNVEEKVKTDEPAGTLYATLFVAKESSANGAAQTGDSACDSMSNNMGYLIGMIVLAALLVFSVAVTVFMFSRMNRPRAEYPKA